MLGQLDEHRQHDHDNRGIVDKGRQGDHADADACNGQPGVIAGITGSQIADPVKAPGADQCAHDHEHRGNGPGGVVGKHLHHIVGGQDAQQHHDNAARDGDHFDRIILAHKGHQHQDHDRDGRKDHHVGGKFDAKHQASSLSDTRGVDARGWTRVNPTIISARAAQTQPE